MNSKLPPIDPSYVPKTSIASLPAKGPVEDIVAVLERDGGLVITDLLTEEELNDIANDLKPYGNVVQPEGDDLIFNKDYEFYPKERSLISGLVGKSETMANICENNPTLEGIREAVLRTKYQFYYEDKVVEHCIEPLLSYSISVNTTYGCSRQPFHRDDIAHAIIHDGNFDMRKEMQIFFLIGTTDFTRENGATLVIPGSHKWDDKRVPRTDEVCFAEMKRGSALCFLASLYHAGGHNNAPGQDRGFHGLSFIRGNMRQEENQFLSIPRSKIAKMSPKMLTLLGYKMAESGLGIVENNDPSLNLKAAFAASEA